MYNDIFNFEDQDLPNLSFRKLIQRCKKNIFGLSHEDISKDPFIIFFQQTNNPDELWGVSMSGYVNKFSADIQKILFLVFLKAEDLGATNKLNIEKLDNLGLLMDQLGTDIYRELLIFSIDILLQMNEKQRIEFDFSNSKNELLSGLIYSFLLIDDPELPNCLSSWVEYIMKQPGSFKVFAEKPMKSAIIVITEFGIKKCADTATVMKCSSLLTKLLQTAKNNNHKKNIRLNLMRLSQSVGKSLQILQDISASDFDFNEGTRNIDFNEYSAFIEITLPSNIQTSWIRYDEKGNRKVQKSDPASVKKFCSSELSKLKSQIKDAQKMIPIHKQRIQNHFLNARKFNYDFFCRYFLNHGLICVIARKLIWQIGPTSENDQSGSLKDSVNVFYQNGKLIDLRGNEYLPKESDFVQIWHPLYSPIDDILEWRNFMIEHLITQPIKQAFREVYIITEAENNTGTYSNRYAGHILKHLQFLALSNYCNWTGGHQLRVYDDGINLNNIKILLPEFDLEAEYYYERISIDDDWNFVTTNQVRFRSLTDSIENIPLIEIPKMVFSEIYRHIDMFVSVASVGADPNWMNTGDNRNTYLNEYRHQFSFGDLSVSANSRKEILLRLIPRLKIASQCTFTNKFLVVKGKIRTYKIHFGSGNILMEPNDQYLCIVPERNIFERSEHIFIPFEGDNQLSIIISKAFLLAADDEIKDPVIVSQISM